jgi:hypothetical protein
MNRHQVILLAVTAANAVLILLFPPFDALVIGRGISTFDAFYFVFDKHANKVVNTDLLLMIIGWLALNAAAGFLLLKENSGRMAMSRRNAVLVFGAVNLALILLFPPFENYASMNRLSGTYFDGFYFVFGDKWQRRFFVPLLYLEILWVLVNTSVLWLAFRPGAEEQQKPKHPRH